MDVDHIIGDIGIHNLRIRQFSKKNMHIRTRVNRKTLQLMAKPLKKWLCKNKTHPYPTRSEKQLLCVESNMTVTQVSNWFANARRRLKITVSGSEVDWEGRITNYNDYVVGKQELLTDENEAKDEKDEDDEDEEDGKEGEKDCIHEKLHSDYQFHNNNEPKGSNKASPVSERIRNVGVASGGGGVASGGGGGDGFGDEMMFRYLNEQQQLVYSALYNKSKIVDQRDRHTSGSLNDFGESQRSASESECNEDDIYWKEINAAMVLTDLSRIIRSKP